MGPGCTARRIVDVGCPVSASPARLVALQVVTRVRERNAYAHETLDAVLKDHRLEERERSFATRLAYGTVASRGTLDEAVARYVKDPSRLEPVVADALAVSAYELLYAASAHHAAVSEGVELVKAVQPKASGLANAVLRKLADAVRDFPWGDPRVSDAALARVYAHPQWLAELWIRELGRETAESVMAADNEPAPLFGARLDTLGGSPPDFAVSECPLPGCFVAESPAAARRSQTVRDRSVLIMDAGAQVTVHSLRPRPGQRLIELGAGRGTKTLLAAELARSSGGAASDILAVDLHAFKLDELSRQADALGVKEIRTLVADATKTLDPAAAPPGSADAVLVDAPCTGLGTLRRHPDRRWRAKPQEIEALAGLGAALLRTAASLVKPGGFVVYSTCTIARRENGEVVEGFLASAQGSEFRMDPLTDEMPPEWRHFVSDEGWFQSLPTIGGMDGHFVARLLRVS